MSERHPGARLGLFSFVLFMTSVYVRPGEVIAAWRGAPVAQILLPICGLLSVIAARSGKFAWSVVDSYAMAFLCVALISMVVSGWAGGTIDVLLTLGPTIIGYFITRVAVGSLDSLRSAAIITVLLSTFLAMNGLLQHYTGTGLGEVGAAVQAADDGSQSDRPADDAEEVRIRGTGIFNDPNDLAFALVLAAPLTIWLLHSRKGLSRLAWTASLAALIFAIFLTRSRGGLIGLGVSSALLLRRIYGRAIAVIVLIIGLCVFAVSASGRVANFDAGEASAQGRVEAWQAGLMMFKTHPIFGVGYGNFLEYHELVAHNSYIHVFAELGIVGAFVFTSLLGSSLLVWRRLTDEPRDRLIYTAWLAASVGGFCCCFFLSRQYSPPLFLLFAVAASIERMRSLARPRGAEFMFAMGTLALLFVVYLASIGLKA